MSLTFIYNHRNEALPQVIPKNKKIKNIILNVLSRFLVYNSLKINMNLPGVGSK